MFKQILFAPFLMVSAFAATTIAATSTNSNDSSVSFQVLRPADQVINEVSYVTAGSAPLSHLAIKWDSSHLGFPITYTMRAAPVGSDGSDGLTCWSGTPLHIDTRVAKRVFTGLDGDDLDDLKWIPIPTGGVVRSPAARASTRLRETLRLEIERSTKIHRSANRPCLETDSYIDAEGNVVSYCTKYGAPVSWDLSLNIRLRPVDTRDSVYEVTCRTQTKDGSRTSFTFSELQTALKNSLEFH